MSEHPTRRERMPPRVLIVDDEPGIRRTLERLLSAWGYATVSAATGADAIARFDEWPPHLVLVDLHLPDMDGRDLAEHLTTRGPGVPCIVITGDYGADTHSLARCLKPFDICELVELVGAHTRAA